MKMPEKGNAEETKVWIRLNPREAEILTLEMLFTLSYRIGGEKIIT